MQDIQLYQQILGIESPWKVESVHLDMKALEVEVKVICQEENWGCPTCQKRMHVHDYEERRWRHLDSCQFKTYVKANVPVVRCPEHGSQTVRVPWAEKHGRFTTLFERLAIDVMRECSVKASCEILRISWDEADGIKQRAVKRGLARRRPEKLERLCVDEKSAGLGQDYVTVVAKVEAGRPAKVWHVGDGRDQGALDVFWQGLTAEQRSSVQAVAMDLWEPYKSSTVAHVPQAAEKIVHDPFHLGRHMNEAVDTVRKAEHKVLTQRGDERLKGSKYRWLYGWENLPEHHTEGFDRLRRQKLKTGRAWSIKEMLREFWSCPEVETAKEYFGRWYGWAIRSRLEPVKKVARMFKRHLPNILTYFIHRLSNGPMEGLNNRIQSLVKKAYGYRNRERFKTDILFHLGGLDLYPAQ